MLYHFSKTIFTIPNNVMHQRSFLNITFFILQSCFYLWHNSILFYLSGDVEINPGPVTNYSQGFKICHWNINSLYLLIILLKFLLEAYAISHNIDVICLSETFLNSSYSSNDTRLHLRGYSLIRADHHRDLKRGGICIYYK